MPDFPTQILISVIVPNYNHEAFLHHRLKSIFGQTYQNIEVILLDDASRDLSQEILKTYSSYPKVSVLKINESNSGSPFLQWKKGICIAKGDFVWIAESDDFCDEKFLETLVQKITDKTVLAYCASNMTNADGTVTGLDPWASGGINKRWLKSYYNKGADEVENFLRFNNTIPNASAVIFRREVALKIRLPIQWKFCGDWWFWIQLIQHGDIAFDPKPLNFFRSHQNSTRSTKSMDMELIRFREYFKIFSLTSNVFFRLGNWKKYKWVLQEWSSKEEIWDRTSIFRAGMPIDFIFRYWLSGAEVSYKRNKGRVLRKIKSVYQK